MMKLRRLSADCGSIAGILRSRAVRALSLATAGVALAVAAGPAAHAAVDPANGRTYPYEYIAPALCNHHFIIESDTTAYDPMTGKHIPRNTTFGYWDGHCVWKITDSIGLDLNNPHTVIVAGSRDHWAAIQGAIDAMHNCEHGIADESPDEAKAAIMAACATGGALWNFFH